MDCPDLLTHNHWLSSKNDFAKVSEQLQHQINKAKYQEKSISLAFFEK